MVTLLWNIKRKLIKRFPNRFNWNNLYFIYNPIGKSYVTLDILKYAPHVFHPHPRQFNRDTRLKYNVSQI
jgi:hypothetical protein